MLYKGGGAGEEAGARGQVDLHTSKLRREAELQALQVGGGVGVGAYDGEECADHGVLDGPRIWQHEAARHDARVEGEAVASNGSSHHPGGLTGANWRVVGKHVLDGVRELDRLGGAARDLP